jgi:hypothetical protein
MGYPRFKAQHDREHHEPLHYETTRKNTLETQLGLLRFSEPNFTDFDIHLLNAQVCCS